MICTHFHFFLSFDLIKSIISVPRLPTYLHGIAFLFGLCIYGFTCIVDRVSLDFISVSFVGIGCGVYI